jgi:putative membrane protein
MKKLSLASIIAAAIIFSACNGNSNTSTSTDTTTNSMSNTDTTNNMNSMDTTNNSANAMATTVDDNAKDFAKEAAEGGMMEVQLGNIAEKNAVTQSVKDFGKMMVDDHSKINDNLKDLAAKKNVTLPTTVSNDQQKHIDRLSKKNGNDFDKDYVSMMIDDHKKDIAEFKKSGDKITDPDFKDFVIKTLPILQKHLDSIQAIKKRM